MNIYCIITKKTDKKLKLSAKIQVSKVYLLI